MLNYYYKDNIDSFIKKSREEIIGQSTLSSQFESNRNKNKYVELHIYIIHKALKSYDGTSCFEFSIQRRGKRVDALFII